MARFPWGQDGVSRTTDGRSPCACRGINLPKAPADAREPLTADQVHALAAAAPARYRALVLVAAESGMRFGELAALRVGRLDLLRLSYASEC